jgi:hypothetical protein
MGKEHGGLELILDRVLLIDSVDVHFTLRSGERMSNWALALATCI